MVKASGSCCAAAGAEKAAAVRAIASAWRNILWVMNLLPTSCLRLPGGADADTEGAGRADQSRRAGDADIISLVGQVPGIAIERQTRRQILDLETKVDQRTGSGLRRQRVVEALELLALVGRSEEHTSEIQSLMS